MGFDEYRPPSGPQPTPPSDFSSAEVQLDIKPADIGQRVGPFLFGFFFFAIGMFPVWLLLLLPMSICYQAQNWPTAIATIEKSQMRVYHGRSTSYGFDVLYRYTFNGIEYRSSRYRPLSISVGYDKAKQLVAQYPVGNTLQVYVNPQRPRYAIIDRSVEGGDWFVVFFLIFASVGAWIMWRASTAMYIRTTRNALGRRTIQFYNSEEAVRRGMQKEKELNEKIDGWVKDNISSRIPKKD